VPPLIARDVADRFPVVPHHEIHQIATKRMGDAMETLQPDEAIIRAVKETEKWIQEHGGRL
jgi:hypothetical protein